MEPKQSSKRKNEEATKDPGLLVGHKSPVKECIQYHARGSCKKQNKKSEPNTPAHGPEKTNIATQPMHEEKASCHCSFNV